LQQYRVLAQASITFEIKIINMKNIVLVLGNGFDLDLGLKTSFKDFWESDSCPQNYPAPMIYHLNGNWPDGLEGVKWYDLENELLNYYKSILKDGYKDIITPREAQFLKEYNIKDNIRGHYSKYDSEILSLYDKELLSLDSSYGVYITIPYLEDLRLPYTKRDHIAFQKIKNGLCEYIARASQGFIGGHPIALDVLLAMKESLKKDNNINIYSFNYTLLPYDYNQEFGPILHYVHGQYKSGNIIIGTQDSNDYNKDYDYLQKSFDPRYAPPAIVYDLLSADEVIIFGHSLGINDRQYFKPFFEKQTSTSNKGKKILTIFTRDDSSVIDIKRSLQQMSNNNLASLYGMNDVKIIRTSKLNEDKDLIKEFLCRYIEDEMLVNHELKQLLNILPH